MDATGNALITGWTNSSNFAGANNGYHGSTGSGFLLPYLGDAFVAKVSTTGILSWATYLGGSEDEVGYGVAVDGAGNALVVGTTASTNFEGSNNIYHGGGVIHQQDAFVARVDSTGVLSLGFLPGWER